MRTRNGLPFVLSLLLVAVACNEEVAGPIEQTPNLSFSQAAAKSPVIVTDNAGSGNFGVSTLIRHPSNARFSWTFTASGLTPGNAVTMWVFPAAGPPGLGGSGVVGGSGTVTLSGNNCLYPVATGKTPGAKPDCGLVDATALITLRLRDHGTWIRGNTAQFRQLNGGCPGGAGCSIPRKAVHP